MCGRYNFTVEQSEEIRAILKKLNAKTNKIMQHGSGTALTNSIMNGNNTVHGDNTMNGDITMNGDNTVHGNNTIHGIEQNLNLHIDSYMNANQHVGVGENMQLFMNDKTMNDKNVNDKTMKTGEVFPTNEMPILLHEDNQVEPTMSIWGYPKYQQKGVLINARAETAIEKKTFRESVLARRCIIPSTGFYEWDKDKRRYYFLEEGKDTLYMAGLYSYYGNEMRYVILTTAANQSMAEIHERMPVIIRKEEIEEWILDPRATNGYLYRIPPMLVTKAM